MKIFVQLMEAFKVATYDQNLMVNGVYLTENESSLGQLKVLPGSLIFLRVSYLILPVGEMKQISFAPGGRADPHCTLPCRGGDQQARGARLQGHRTSKQLESCSIS